MANLVDDEEINLADLWFAVKKHFKMLVLITAVAVVLVGIITYFFIPKKYQSSVAFYIHEKGSPGMLSMLESQLGGLGGFLPGVSGGTNADLCSDIILARQFLKQILKAEGQPCRPEDIKKFSQSVQIKKSKSNVVTVAVLAKDPKLAFSLTKRIYAKYQDVIENEIYRTNNSNRIFIQEELIKAQKRLEQAEQNLLAYQQKNGILLLPEEASKAIEYLAELEKNRMQVTVGLNEARQRLHKADVVLDHSGKNVKESVRAAVNPLIQGYKSKLTEIEVKLAEARQTMTDQHPIVKSLLAQRAELLTQIQHEEKVVSSPEIAGEYLKGLVEVAGLEARQDSLNKIYNEIKSDIDKMPKNLLEYGQLLREQKVAEQIYLLLVSQLEQARIAEDKEQNVEIQIIDAPVVPDRKYSPSAVINMLVTFVLMTFLGVGVAVFKEREIIFGKNDTRIEG